MILAAYPRIEREVFSSQLPYDVKILTLVHLIHVLTLHASNEGHIRSPSNRSSLGTRPFYSDYFISLIP